MADWSYCEYRIAGEPEELDRLFGIMQKVENAEGGPWLCDLMTEINGEEAEDGRGQWSELKREEDCISFVFEGAGRTYIEEWDEVCDNFETLCPYFEGVLWAYQLAQKRENPEKGWFPNKYYLDMRYTEYGDDEARSFRTLEDVYKRIEELTGTKISSEEDVEALRSALEEENDDTFILIYEIEEIPRGGSGYHTLFPWGDMSDWEIEEEVDDDIPEATAFAKSCDVVEMSSVFEVMSGAKEIDLSSVDTSKVTDMHAMFKGCGELRSLNLSSFDTSNVTDMHEMFKGCYSLEVLDLSSFDTSEVTDMHEMFKGCPSLEVLDLSSFDTSEVTDMHEMFCLPKYNGLHTIVISSFDTSNVTDMSGMFSGCSELRSIDLSSFDTSKVTDMSRMFYHCWEWTSLDLGSFNTSNVANMSQMFSWCTYLTSLDLSSFDTSKVTDMSEMFKCCYGLTSLDLSPFDTSKVADMHGMFNDCNELRSLDLSSFDTSKVTDMSEMFSNCFKLKSLNLSSFDTSKVTDMCEMFKCCYGLTTLDISTFNLSKVKKNAMLGMFEACRSLKTVIMKNCSAATVRKIKAELPEGVEIIQ